MKTYKFAILLLITSAMVLTFTSSHSGNSRKQEIVLTLGEPAPVEKDPLLLRGDSLRKAGSLNDAIKAYLQLVEDKAASPSKSEAHYNIGLCYTLTGNKEGAREVFDSVIKTYPNDKTAIAYATYGLAWVTDQEMKHKESVAILDGIIANQEGDDKLQASALLKRGGIYLYKLGDREKARQDFLKLVELYPESHAASLSFVQEMGQLMKGGEND